MMQKKHENHLNDLPTVENVQTGRTWLHIIICNSRIETNTYFYR